MATTVKSFQNRAENLVQEFEIADLSTTPVAVSVVACRVQWIWVDNSASGNTNYLKLYDKATTPVPATDYPNLIIPLQPGFQGAIQIVPAGSSAGLPFASGLYAVAHNAKELTGAAPVPEVDVSIGII